MNLTTDRSRLTYLIGVVDSIIAMSEIDDASGDVIDISEILKNAKKKIGAS